MDINVILNPIIKLFIAIAIGFLAGKTGYLGENVRQSISKIIVNITLPLLILTSLLSRELSADLAIGALISAVSCIVIVTVLYFLGLLTAKMFRLSEPTKTLHAVLSASGNVAFLGYPLVGAVFGPEARFFAIVYGMVNDIIFWTMGIYLVNRSANKNETEKAYKKLLNPTTISIILGTILLFLKFKLPPVINDSFTGIGETTTYLSMIFIGMTLAKIDITKIYKRVSMTSPVLLKMIIVPIAVAYLFTKIGINPLVIGGVVLEIAMPAQTVTSIVAMEAGSDEQYAAEYIFFSTLLSLVTLPLVYYVMQGFIG